jgi:PKD repeat protein/photosystem II stability/assembly factor-like uncharacterized protein
MTLRVTRVLLAIIVGIAAAGIASAQFIAPLSMPPESADMPSWARFMYSQPVNISALDSAYDAYIATHPGEKNNYTKYYRRMRRLTAPFVSADGMLRSLTPQDVLRSEGETATGYANGNGNVNSNVNASANASNDKSANKIQSPAATVKWTPIGPMETYFTSNGTSTPALCPWQVNIYGFDIAPSNPNILYAVSETGGFFKSTNKGVQWTQLEPGVYSSSEAIAIHPSNPDVVYVGISGGLIKTTNGGSTWTSVWKVSNLWIYDIEVMSNQPSVLLAATNQGFYRSTDAGGSWTRSMDRSCCDLETHPLNKSIVYTLRANSAGTRTEMWKSTDGGLNFTQRSGGWLTSSDSKGAGRMTVTPADPERVYAVLLGDSSRPYILRSDNAGESWRVSARGKSDSLAMTNGQGYYDLGIAASHRDANVLLVGTTTCYRSNDGGNTFPVTIGGYSGVHAIHPDIQEIKCLGDDCYIATDGGMNYSTDMFGANYAARTIGLNGADFWGFDAGWNEDVLVGGRYHNGNTAWHENYGTKFLRMGGGEAATGYVHPMRNRDVYFSDIGAYTIPTASNQPVQSRPVGMFPNESYYAMEYSAMKWHPVYTSEVWMGNKNNIMRSANNGASYSSVFTSPDTGAVIQHIEICRSNPDVMYVSQRSNVLYDGKIWKSTNAGADWTTCAELPGTTRSERRVMKIAASSKSSSTLFVALLNGSKTNKVFKTANGGATWINLTTDLIGNQGITDIVVQYGTDDGVYIACYNGKVYYRNASMTEWALHGEGLPYALFTRALKPFYRDNKLRTGSSMGVWEAPLYEHSKPEAQPCVDKRTSACVRDTFYFDDYSVLELANARRRWSFPGATFVSDSTARNPRVLYSTPGVYSATLTVTNDYGTSTKTLQNVINITKSECDVEGIAGSALDLSATNDAAAIPALPQLQTGRGFTASCWVKLDTIQASFSQILSNWNSPVGFSLGFSFQGYRANTNLTFYWKNVPYQLTSPFNLPVDEWTHVAISVDSSQVTLYRNGTPWVYKNANANFYAPNLSTTAWEIGGGLPGQGGNFRGMIDELQIFDRALDSTQIRERMNLISNPPGYVDTTKAPVPVAYYQFNEPTFTRFYNRTGALHAENSGGKRAPSTCPVGAGVSNSILQKEGVWSADAGMTISHSGAAERTIVVTRIDAAPNVLPANTSSVSPHYWVVRSYGTATAFATDSMQLRGTGSISAADAANPGTLRLYARGTQEYRNTWVERSSARSADTVRSTVSFAGDTNFTAQFILGSVGSSPLDVEDEDEDNEGNDNERGNYSGRAGIERISVLPTPSAELVCVRITEPATGLLQVLDLTGRVLLQATATQSETRIDTSSLPSGLYMVTVPTSRGLQSAPLLVSRSERR